MHQDKVKEVLEYVISITTGEVTAATVGIISIGKSSIIAILLHGSTFDFGVLCAKTFVLAAIGGLGGLTVKYLWNKLKNL